MQNNVKITFLATAGIMISYKNIKILIDAIHLGNEYFSSVREHTLNEILEAKGKFNGINFLLYSHYHNDHIDFGTNLKFLEKNNVKNIILPFDPYHRAVDFKENLKKKGINYIQPDIGLDQKQVLTFDDGVTLTCYREPHDGGDKFKSVHHYAYLVSIGDKNILVGADSPILDCYMYHDLSENYHIDAVLFNLLFSNSKTGRDLINLINPDRLIIYHLPFADHPNKMYRNIAKSDAQKYKGALPPITVFDEELMEINI